MKNFTEFLGNSLNRTVLEYSLKSLTKPGDNFGAVLNAITVKVAGDNNILNLVIKTPVTNPHLVELVKPAVTFVKEVRFYTDIIPALEHFEEIANVPREERLDAFIPCLGWRFSLNSNTEYADSDAILLLENIKLQNFTNVDMRIGFDTNETLAILKILAKFHALCIAIRRLQPTVYNTKIDPYAKLTEISNHTSKKEIIFNEMKHALDLSVETTAALDNAFTLAEKHIKKLPTDTPYTTIIHNDMWINNVMVRKDTGPTKIKLYDFQSYSYDSFVYDLTFFLFRSVRNHDLETNFTSFVDYYFSEFQKMLKMVKCPMADYTHKKMWHELREKAKFTFHPLIRRVKVMKANHNTELDKWDEDSNPSNKPPSRAAVDQWKFITDMFVQNGLLKHDAK